MKKNKLLYNAHQALISMQKQMERTRHVESLKSDSKDSSNEDHVNAEDLDSELNNLTQMATIETAKYEGKIKELRGLASQYDKDIEEKERLMDELTKSKLENDATQKQYLQKIKEMEKEVKMVSDERDKVLEDLKQKGQDIANNLQLQKYQARIKELTKKLTLYKDQQKENEVLKNNKKLNDAKILKLQEDIIKAKKTKVELEKKINEKGEEYREWLKRKRKKRETINKGSTT